MAIQIESRIECPFYKKLGETFITCEGILDNSKTTHRFSSATEKTKYLEGVCCKNGGKKCPHFRSVSILYERGLRT